MAIRSIFEVKIRLIFSIFILMELIEKYFPELTEEQKKQFSQLQAIYGEWNAKINVISRQDIDHLYLRHVLHSLAIAKVCEFESGAEVMDVGTGGGFPGIPLAILFPEVNFTLVDSTKKKITVVEEVVKGLSLNNVTTKWSRVEEYSTKYDYIVSRAVTEMSRFIRWTWRNLRRGKKGTLPNGILYLKGGDLIDELARADKQYTIYDIQDFFEDEFFESKKVVYIPYNSK